MFRENGGARIFKACINNFLEGFPTTIPYEGMAAIQYVLSFFSLLTNLQNYYHQTQICTSGMFFE